MAKRRAELTPEQLAKVREYHRQYKAKKWAEDPEAQRAVLRARYAKNPEKYKAKAIARTRRKDPAAFRAERAADYAANKHRWISDYRRRKYGITAPQLDEMIARHGGRCGICDTEFALGAGNDNPRQMHVDHNHTTGVVRGLLCRDCNLGLGRFKDSPRSLARAIRYLANEAERAALVRNDDALVLEPFTYIA